MTGHLLNDTDMASQTIFIHSTDAVLNISDAEKVYYLNQAIVAPPGFRLLVGLSNATFANSMFNVTSTTNGIKFVTSSGNFTVSIPVGNYTARTIATAIETGSSSAGLSGLSVLFNTNNNTFTFSHSSFKIQSTTMFRQLGLRGQTVEDGGNFSSAVSSYTTQDICDLGGVTNVYVRIKNLTMNNLDSKGNTTNTIANIINNTNYGGYLFYSAPETLYYQIQENSIGHLNIELSSQNGELIEMNGCEYNLTITVHYVKQRENERRSSLLRQIESNYETEKEKKNKSP